jgi:sulfate/thiosulfate transport system ATP-binding protein
VRRVRAFGPIQRADVALKTNGSETMIEIDAPRDTELKVGDVIGLKPKRYRIFAAGK